MEIKKKIFYIFLVLHAVCWSLLQLMRNIISLDAMEAISWGELISFGTNKHPPLSGWLMAGFYNLFGKFKYDFFSFLLLSKKLSNDNFFQVKLNKVII